MKKKVVKSSSAIKKVALGSEWKPEMSVHENIIDKQHQTLLSKLNMLIKDANSNDMGVVRGLISFLDKYSKEHFSYEEAYMKKNNFPGLQKHKQIHIKFRKFYEGYEKEFNKAYIDRKITHIKLISFAEKAKKYLSDWLTHHIMKEDMKYAEYIGSLNKKQGKSKLVKTKNEKVSEKNLDMSSIKSEIEQQLKKQRAPVEHISKIKDKKGAKSEEYIKTGIPGFDELFERGIPKGNTVLVAGGAGSGKTIFCLQTLVDHAEKGDRCFYMSFEESEDKLKDHMRDFGWNPDKLIKSGKLKIQRTNPFEITRNVDALLAQQKGELLIEIDPVILPENFKPDFVVLDSLTAIASAFTGREDSYRIYIEQLFRFFEKIGCTTFLITETEQVPKIYSTTGVEEFLADGVIVLYNIKRGDVRENAVEVLKMRGEKHQKKIVAMQITGNGIVIYPEQEVFGGVEE